MDRRDPKWDKYATGDDFCIWRVYGESKETDGVYESELVYKIDTFVVAKDETEARRLTVEYEEFGAAAGFPLTDEDIHRVHQIGEATFMPSFGFVIGQDSQERNES